MPATRRQCFGVRPAWVVQSGRTTSRSRRRALARGGSAHSFNGFKIPSHAPGAGAHGTGRALFLLPRGAAQFPFARRGDLCSTGILFNSANWSASDGLRVGARCTLGTSSRLEKSASRHMRVVPTWPGLPGTRPRTASTIERSRARIIVRKPFPAPAPPASSDRLSRGFGAAVGCGASENSTGRSKTGFASARCCPTKAHPLAIAGHAHQYRIAPSLAVIRITRRPSIRASARASPTSCCARSRWRRTRADAPPAGQAAFRSFRPTPSRTASHPLSSVAAPAARSLAYRFPAPCVPAGTRLGRPPAPWVDNALRAVYN